MKVIHVFNEFKFSGAEIMYVDAAPLFQQKGCELTAVSTSDQLGDYSPYFEKAGYKLMHLPLPPLKRLGARIRFYKNFIKLLKCEKYDIVHIHRSDAMWGIALCAWLAGVKSLYTFHNVFPTKSYTYIYHCLLRFSAKRIFNCSFQTISDSVYNHELHFFHNRTTKVYNWYSNHRFYPENPGEKEEIRKELGIPIDSLVVISIGGCSHIKRHSDIIKALPDVLKDVSNCVYLHLGDGFTKHEEEELAAQTSVSDHVRFLNNQTNVRKYLIASDIYLMTSKFEGISLTTIEAMACNRPAILYNVAGLRDFNTSGENCLLIPEDVSVLAKNILYLHKNPTAAKELAGKGKELVENLFSMTKNTEQIFKLYQKG